MATRIVYFFTFLLFCGFSSAAQNSLTFNFTKKSEDARTIQSAITYSTTSEYGFDFNTANNVHFKQNGFTANQPVYFSVKLPEGNYQVTVLQKDSKQSPTTIKAESRKLMVHETSCDLDSITFVINKFEPGYQHGKKQVSLKDRERDDLKWDNKLTLEFNQFGTIQQIKIKKVDIPTIFLAGDSTVTDQDYAPWASWGQFFTNYLSPTVAVANYAFSGAALGSFKGSKRLDKIVTQIKSGDYVLIEFGHNDEKVKGEGNGAYGLFSNLLREYITAIQEKGGEVILLTPTQRRHFDKNGELKATHGNFPDATRKVAAEFSIPVIDLTEITTKMYEAWGLEESKHALVHYPANSFPGQTEELADNTHFSTFGANEIALAVVQEINNQQLAIAHFIKEDVANYEFSQPNSFSDWDVPFSPRSKITKPDGN